MEELYNGLSGYRWRIKDRIVNTVESIHVRNVTVNSLSLSNNSARHCLRWIVVISDEHIHLPPGFETRYSMVVASR